MSRFSERFVEYYLEGKTEEEVMQSLRKDSFNLVCALADDIADDKLDGLPIQYRDRVMNIALIFTTVIKNERKKRNEIRTH